MEKLFHNVQRAIKLIRDNRGSYLGQQQPHDNIFKVIVLLLYTLLEGANHTPLKGTIWPPRQWKKWTDPKTQTTHLLTTEMCPCTPKSELAGPLKDTIWPPRQRNCNLITLPATWANRNLMNKFEKRWFGHSFYVLIKLCWINYLKYYAVICNCVVF